MGLDTVVFEGNTQFYTIYGRESFLHLCIMVEDPFFRYQTAFKYFFCLLAMQRIRVFTRSLPWSKALFINLSCHHGRYCPVVDHKSVLPTGHAHEHSCKSNLTPTDAWHREHILNSSCNKHNLMLLRSDWYIMRGLNTVFKGIVYPTWKFVKNVFTLRPSKDVDEFVSSLKKILTN